MNKKRFYEQIKKTVEHEKNVKKINVYKKIKIKLLVERIKKELIESINYYSSNDSVISISLEIIGYCAYSIFGKKEMDREKNIAYFKSLCKELDISIGVRIVENHSEVLNDYMYITASINNPSIKKEKTL